MRLFLWSGGAVFLPGALWDLFGLVIVVCWWLFSISIFLSREINLRRSACGGEDQIISHRGPKYTLGQDDAEH